MYPLSWAADGSLVVLARRGDLASDDIMLLDADGQQLEPIVDTDFNETNAAISPDGAWLAYVSNDAGRSQVFVRRFPGPSGRTPISPVGAFDLRWSPDGGSIYYFSDSSMWAASLRFTPEVSVVERRPLFGVQVYRILGQGLHLYDVHPDTGRFLFVKNDVVAAEGNEGEQPHLSVVLNWFEELKQRVPTGR